MTNIENERDKIVFDLTIEGLSFCLRPMLGFIFVWNFFLICKISNSELLYIYNLAAPNFKNILCNIVVSCTADDAQMQIGTKKAMIFHKNTVPDSKMQNIMLDSEK